MFDHSWVRYRLADPVERVGTEFDIHHSAKIHTGIGRIDMFDPINRPIQGFKHVADDMQAVNKRPCPMRFDHDPIELICHVIARERVPRNRQTTKRKANPKFWILVVFVRPLDKVVINIVASDQRFAIRLGDDHAALADTVSFIISVEPVVANNCATGPTQNTKVLEPNGPIVTNFCVICIGVEPDGNPVFNWNWLLVRDKLAPVNLQPLTALMRRCDATVKRSVDIAICDLERHACFGKHDPTRLTLTLKINLGQLERCQLVEPTEIQQVFEPGKGISLRSFSIKDAAGLASPVAGQHQPS